MSFLKTVLIILLVYLGVKFLFRLLSPYLIRYITKKASQRFERAFQQGPFGDPKPQNEGAVTIDKMPKSDKSDGHTVGEYVDFEEIE
ncbi:MAG: DUF4834 domain-containing protein [Flavobacteriaceae bacterium]|nr:DUF4834 domain-containing protein [Flavobacteriaceae bacterium]